MSEKMNYTVARNAAYAVASVEVRERHNERKNEEYYNADINIERKNFNVHFCRYQFPDGTPVTYEQRLNQLLAADIIVKRGLKDDAKVIDELILDVNTEYFERGGGYDFAKKFYEEAYRYAVKEVGSEDYILSAVMHADEKNVGLSDRLGYDVYHYHLHVMYVPVVEKEVLWSKRCKDPALVGTVKEVISQISHSKKWPRGKDKNGKWVNAYSLLQDRFFEHMKTAGFENIERGQEGSTAEHLEVVEYKVQQEKKRLDVIDGQIEKKAAKSKKLDDEIAVKTTKKSTLKEIDEIGKPSLIGGVHLTDDEAKRLKSHARQTVKSDERIAKLRSDINALQTVLDKTKEHLDTAKREVNHWHREYTTLWNEVKDFIVAIRKFPVRLKEFIAELFRPEREAEQRQQAEVPVQQKSKSKGMEI